VRLWNATTGAHLKLLDEGDGWVRFVQFSPDGTRLFLGRETSGNGRPNYQGEVRAYSIPAGERLAEWPLGDRVMCGAISADGRYVAVAIGLGGANDPFGDPGAAAKNEIVVFDAESGERIIAFTRGIAEPMSIAFSDDGRELYQLGDDGQITAFDWRTGTRAEAVGVNLAPNVPRTASFLRGDIQIRGDTEKLALFDLRNNKRVWQRGIEGLRATTIAAPPDGELLAVYFRRQTGSRVHGRLALMTAATGEEVARFELTDNNVRSLVFSRDGKRLAAGMELGDVVIWDVAGFNEQQGANVAP
jgi:WD40 repeat protein